MASLYGSESISGVRARELLTAPDLLLANTDGFSWPEAEAIEFISPASVSCPSLN